VVLCRYSQEEQKDIYTKRIHFDGDTFSECTRNSLDKLDANKMSDRPPPYSPGSSRNPIQGVCAHIRGRPCYDQSAILIFSICWRSVEDDLRSGYELENIHEQFRSGKSVLRSRRELRDQKRRMRRAQPYGVKKDGIWYSWQWEMYVRAIDWTSVAPNTPALPYCSALNHYEELVQRGKWTELAALFDGEAAERGLPQCSKTPRAISQRLEGMDEDDLIARLGVEVCCLCIRRSIAMNDDSLIKLLLSFRTTPTS
jgi:hypothetical protein